LKNTAEEVGVRFRYIGAVVGAVLVWWWREGFTLRCHAYCFEVRKHIASLFSSFFS